MGKTRLKWFTVGEMAKENHKPVPRYRSYDGPTIFTHGFRPFFLIAGIWALIVLVLSLGQILGYLTLPSQLDAVSWHFHELLFGYVSAAVAGFLLTAVPNWTGRLPLQGRPLIILVLAWLAGRLAVAGSEVIGIWPAVFIDLAFLAMLAGVTLRELIAGRNWRNLPIVIAILVWLISNLLFYGEQLGILADGKLSWRLAIAVVIMLISLVGGRIIPSFSRNWLVKRGIDTLPAPFGKYDKVTLAVTLVCLGSWVVTEEGPLDAAMFVLAAALNLLRLIRWRGWAVRGEPLLWVLHIAYGWIPVGLMMLALSYWVPGMPQAGAVHALTIGAIGTMTLAVMSRATLGHTGRTLKASSGLTIAYVLITIAAGARVGSEFLPHIYMPALYLAATSWIGAYLAYLAVCGPMLVKPRARGG